MVKTNIKVMNEAIIRESLLERGISLEEKEIDELVALCENPWDAIPIYLIMKAAKG